MIKKLTVIAIVLSTAAPLVAFADTTIAQQPDYSVRSLHNESQTNITLIPLTTGNVTSVQLSGKFSEASTSPNWFLQYNQDGWIRNYTTAMGINGASSTPYITTDGFITIPVVCSSAFLAAHPDPDDGTTIHCPISSLVSGTFSVSWGASVNIHLDGDASAQAYINLNGTYTASDITRTRVVSTTPANGAIIATSTTATLGGTVYINPTEYQSGIYVEQKYARQSDSQGSVANPDSLFTTVQYPIASAGLTSFSTTTSILGTGQYVMTTTIRAPSLVSNALNWLGFSQFATQGTLISTSTTFTAVQQNQFDVFVASTTAAINTYLASSTISLASCSTWTQFNLGDCLGLLLLPQWVPIKNALTDFKEGFLSRWPLGYVTRTFAILLSPQTSTLPSLVIHMPRFLPTAGQDVDLTPWTHLLGAGSYLTMATNPDTGHTLYDIVYDGWAKFVYLLGTLVIILDLLGLGTATIGAEEREANREGRANKAEIKGWNDGFLGRL